MKHSCKNCDSKHTCPNRSMALFLLFVQTGRADELTNEVMENFSFCTDCESWKPIRNDEPTQSKEA